MRIIAISPDDADDSRTFAKRYGIRFSLVSDEDLIIAREYVGVDSNGYPLPGVVVITRDGKIHRRQIARNKYDRIYAAQLIAILDTLPGASNNETKVAVRGRYTALARRELVFGLAGRTPDDTSPVAAGRGHIALVWPLSRRVAVGAVSGVTLGEGDVADIAALVRLRHPVWADQGSLYGQLSLGGGLDLDREDPPAHSRVGIVNGAAIGFQFAWFPGLSIHMQLETNLSWFRGKADADNKANSLITLGGGVSILF